MQKARRHPALLHGAPTACRHVVSGSVSSPNRGSSHLSVALLFTIGRQGVLSLGRWTSQIQTRFHVAGSTRVPIGRRHNCRIRDCHPLWFRFPSDSSSWPFCNSTVIGPTTPLSRSPTVWALSVSLAATKEVELSFFSCGYLDVSVDRVVGMHLCIQCMSVRESRDQSLFDNSPGLIADFHALHNLLTPRHPPHALSNLTTMILAPNTRQSSYGRPSDGQPNHCRSP